MMHLFRRLTRQRPRCRECGLPFNDWFTWGGARHCYPCWVASGYRYIYLCPKDIRKGDPRVMKFRFE